MSFCALLGVMPGPGAAVLELDGAAHTRRLGSQLQWTSAEAVGGSVGGVRNDRAMLMMRIGTGAFVKRPTKPRVSAAVANLQPGQSLVLERVEDEPGDWYIQVRMREGNSFQLEYRDGVASEHYQTLTVAREKVVSAMLGWMKGDTQWRTSFMWNNIGSWFEIQSTDG